MKWGVGMVRKVKIKKNVLLCCYGYNHLITIILKNIHVHLTIKDF